MFASEEIHYLDVAIKRCQELRASLLMNLHNVQILNYKIGSKTYETRTTYLHWDDEWGGGDAISARSLPIIDSQRSDHGDIRLWRSIKHVNRCHNELTTRVIKMRRSVEEILVRVELLRKKQELKLPVSKARALRKKGIFTLQWNRGHRHLHCFHTRRDYDLE